MALARTHAVTLIGVEGHPVEVEADLAPGLPGTHLVGLPDAALAESRDRVRAAVSNTGEAWPQHRITVSLYPASLPKRGSSFDLAIACAVLAAAGAVPPGALDGTVLLGELGLDGRIRPVRGVLPALLAAAAAGLHCVAVPEANATEAALVPGVRVLSASSLADLLAQLRGHPEGATVDGGSAQAANPPTSGNAPAGEDQGDLADVLGQPAARRGLEVAAAGGHHVHLLGPPGSGKTMLAQRLPTILPPLDRESALEATAIHSVAGTLPPHCPLVTQPPFADPHHTATAAAVVGGGSGQVRPGAASLAHLGVLFLDEAPEFSSGVLDALRQPLESGEVTIFRSGVVARFPARFCLVLAANPCPCARSQQGQCTCTPHQIRRYTGRLSGPLLDRVDLNLELFPVRRVEMVSDQHYVESSSVVAERVAQARQRAAQRLAGTPWRVNARVPGSELRSRFAPAPGALRWAEVDMERGLLTARGLDRAIRVAWTLADLAGLARPGAEEIQTAVALRKGVPT